MDNAGAPPRQQPFGSLFNTGTLSNLKSNPKAMRNTILAAISNLSTAYNPQSTSHTSSPLSHGEPTATRFVWPSALT